MKFKTEAAFQTAFKGWAKQNITKTTAIELKLVKDGGFKLSSWMKRYSHQARGLMGAKKNGIFHKISDMSMDLKPFDCFLIKDSDAFMAIYFNEFEKFIMIDIEEVLDLTKKVKTATFDELLVRGRACNF